TLPSSKGSVTLSWSAVPDAVSYRVYRGTSSGSYDTVFTTPNTTFSDTGCSPCTSGAPPSSSSIFGTETTAPINWQADTTAPAPAIQAKLVALAHIDPSDVLVSPADPNDSVPHTFDVTFQNGLGNRLIPQLLLDGSGLTNDGLVQQIVVPAGTGTFW